MNTLVAKWRFTPTSPKLGDRLFSAFSSPGRVVYRNVAFLTRCTSLCPAIKQDQDGHYSSAELQTGRKVRNCQTLASYKKGSGWSLFKFWAWNGKKGEKFSNFDHIWPLVNFNASLYYMTQLWCEWSYWFHFLFACRPLAPTLQWSRNFWHCCEYFSRKVKIHGDKPHNLEIGYFQLSAALGELFREMWLFLLGTPPYVQLYKQDQDGQYSMFWAWNGKKGEKLSHFENIWPPVNFNASLYNMTQL